MRDALDTIRQFLFSLQRRSAILACLETCALSVTLFCTLVLLAAGLGTLHLTHEALGAVFWLLLFGIPLVWWLRVILPRHLQMRGEQAAARQVDRRIPSTDHMTLSAVELAGVQSTFQGFSTALVRAAVEDAAERIRFLPVSRVLSYRTLIPWFLAMAASSVILVGISWLAPAPFAAGLRAFFSPPRPGSSPVVPTPVVAAERGPELGDITLTLDFPAYLERAPKMLENATGEVFAPLGTLVTLTARCAIVADRVRIQVDQDTPAVATLEDSGRFTGTFLVQRDGAYRVLLYPPHSDDPVVTRDYSISVEPDAAPTVQIFGLEPSTEITADDAIPFTFRAEDDHGLTRVDIVVSGPQGVARKSLKKIDPPRDWEEAQVTWYPAEWDVSETGTLTLWLEVRDNDTVSGPKVGVSQRYEMVLAGPKRQHAKVLEAKEALKEALIGLLGDLLVQHDSPSKNKSPEKHQVELAKLTEDTQKVFSAFSALGERMESDTLEEITVVHATRAILDDLLKKWDTVSRLLKMRAAGNPDAYTTTGDRTFREARSAFIASVEHAVLSMESFANLQRMEALTAMGRNLRKTGDSLRDLIESLQRSGEKPDAQALLDKLDEMEKQLAVMAAKFAALDRLSSEWFQNPTDETHKLQDMMDEIRDAIRKGDLATAKQKLEDYLKSTEEMLAALDDMQREEFEGFRDSVVKDMQGVIDGLHEMERQQSTLLADTEATSKALRESAGLTDPYLDGIIKRSLDRAKTIREAVAASDEAVKASHLPMTTPQERRARELLDQLDTLEAALRARDMLQAHREAMDTLRGSRVHEAGLGILEARFRTKLDEAKSHARVAVDESEALVKEMDEMLDRMERMRQMGVSRGQGLASRQRSLQRESEALGKRLEGYAQNSPLIPSQWGDRMGEAAQSMKGASQKLDSGELSGGAGDERMALQTISNLLQELETAREQIAQRMRGGTGGHGKFRLMPNSSGRQGQQEYWGGRELRVGRVDIAKEYQAPEEYRKEIMEGMQGEAPARYKELNRDYYEKLVH